MFQSKGRGRNRSAFLVINISLRNRWLPELPWSKELVEASKLRIHNRLHYSHFFLAPSKDFKGPL